MSNPWFYKVLRPAFVNEDYSEVITIDGDGDISAWTLEASLYDAGGTEIVAPPVTIVDAEARTIRVTIAGENLTTTQDDTLIVRRTDTGARTQIAWGVLEVVNPLQQLGWGAGLQ